MSVEQQARSSDRISARLFISKKSLYRDQASLNNSHSSEPMPELITNSQNEISSTVTVQTKTTHRVNRLFFSLTVSVQIDTYTPFVGERGNSKRNYAILEFSIPTLWTRSCLQHEYVAFNPLHTIRFSKIYLCPKWHIGIFHHDTSHTSGTLMIYALHAVSAENILPQRKLTHEYDLLGFYSVYFMEILDYLQSHMNECKENTQYFIEIYFDLCFLHMRKCQKNTI